MFQHQCWSLLFCVKVNKSFTLTKVYFSILRINLKKEISWTLFSAIEHQLTFFTLWQVSPPPATCCHCQRVNKIKGYKTFTKASYILTTLFSWKLPLSPSYLQQAQSLHSPRQCLGQLRQCDHCWNWWQSRGAVRSCRVSSYQRK